jgi:hypothetical protein
MMLYVKLAAAIAVFIAGWMVNGWRLGNQIDAMKLAASEAKVDAQASARSKEQEFQTRLQEAQNAAKKREDAMRRDANNSRASAGRLRDDLQAIQRNLPVLAADACRRQANALTELFGSCVEQYRGVAEEADRDASDKQTLIEAWPK